MICFMPVLPASLRPVSWASKSYRTKKEHCREQHSWTFAAKQNMFSLYLFYFSKHFSIRVIICFYWFLYDFWSHFGMDFWWCGRLVIEVSWDSFGMSCCSFFKDGLVMFWGCLNYVCWGCLNYVCWTIWHYTRPPLTSALHWPAPSSVN